MTMSIDLPSPPASLAGDGVFPFGQPNTPRPARWDGQGMPRQLVLGVYPSALHISWRAPRSLSTAPVRISALAVDVEPVVFWDGIEPSAVTKVDDWKSRVGFVDGDTPDSHGHARTALNGPSGDILTGYFAGPIHSPADTVFADVYPVFQVKRSGPRAKRAQQGDAIDQRFNPHADHLPDTATGRPGPATLPTRIPPPALPPAAVERFDGWILELLRTVRPELVVTLGQEPWTTLGLLPGVRVEHDQPDLASTRTRGYGKPGTLHLDDQAIPWIPLAHPGLLSSPAADDREPTWRQAHDTWTSST
jgi:hypothetical protein